MMDWYAWMGNVYFLARFSNHPHMQWQQLAHDYVYIGYIIVLFTLIRVNINIGIPNTNLIIANLHTLPI